MSDNNLERKILAYALYQIRILLSGCLGSQSEAPIDVQIAAQLAYALHNEALCIMEDKGFNAAEALAKIERIDEIFNVKDGTELSNLIRAGKV